MRSQKSIKYVKWLLKKKKKKEDLRVESKSRYPTKRLFCPTWHGHLLRLHKSGKRKNYPALSLYLRGETKQWEKEETALRSHPGSAYMEVWRQAAQVWTAEWEGYICQIAKWYHWKKSFRNTGKGADHHGAEKKMGRLNTLDCKINDVHVWT